MNVIDLEILIPASPEFIWRFLGDLSAIPKWQEQVESVAFLSTQREGRGARWRLNMQKSSDYIVEVSAWYDRLGYEYRIVDGGRFAENQGRIRSHEVAEGTLVRWTFEYELGGILGGLRNAMRLKRNTSKQIQASLRNLHQLIVQESGGISTHEAKAIMQDAPGVDERVAYQPRHASPFQDDAPDDTDLVDIPPEQPLPELLPAVVDTDTKPNPVVLAAAASELPSEPRADAIDDTRPIEVEVFLPTPYSQSGTASTPAPTHPGLQEPSPAPRTPVPPAPRREPPEDADDPSQRSIFDIFGLQRPSESGQSRSEPPREQPKPMPEPSREASGLPRAEFRWREGLAAESVRPAAVPAATITGLRRTHRLRQPRLRSHSR